METAIRVISVSGSLRRETFHRPAVSLGLAWQFLDASLGLADGLQFDPRLSLLHSKRVLEQGEIGCFGSHVRAWRELLTDPRLKQLIVIEDDVFADWTVMAEVSRYDWAAMNVHYLKLCAIFPFRFRNIDGQPPIVRKHLVEFTKPPLGTQAYLITRHAAERFETSFHVISRTIDVQMDRGWANKIPVHGLFPFPAMELATPSVIGENRWLPARLTGRDRIRYFVGRALEHLRKALYPWIKRPIQIPRIAMMKD